jgi:hypothetical protein
VSVVEITTFRLADDAEEAAFLAADKVVQTELVPNQPGFMRRTTARRGRHVVVVTLWGRKVDAAAFETVAKGHPLQVAFESHLDAASISTSRYETLD